MLITHLLHVKLRDLRTWGWEKIRSSTTAEIHRFQSSTQCCWCICFTYVRDLLVRARGWEKIHSNTTADVLIHRFRSSTQWCRCIRFTYFRVLLVRSRGWEKIRPSTTCTADGLMHRCQLSHWRVHQSRLRGVWVKHTKKERTLNG